MKHFYLVFTFLKFSLVWSLAANERPVTTLRRSFLKHLMISSWMPSVLLVQNANASTDEGLSQITDSVLGKSVRKFTIQGARIMDNLDEKWERLSDGLRDENKCDPNTNRRLYDNGYRKDGTRVGNPVLGAPCQPQPLSSLDVQVAELLLDMMVDAAVSSNSNGTPNRSNILEKIQDIKALVQPSFERDMAQSQTEEEKMRKEYNFKTFCTLKAIITLCNFNNRSSLQNVRAFQSRYGNALLHTFAQGASKQDYYSPFPDNDDFQFNDNEYDKDNLIQSLGAIRVVLDKFQKAGLNGFYEISIPYDDYGSVVTIAIDDDITIGTDMLLVEQGLTNGLSGGCGPYQSMVRAALENSNLAFGMDTFYLDPSTTKQSVYNPTQLLLSMNNLRKA